MNARNGVVAGVLLAGAAAWAQTPAERAEEIARLKARVESAELAREADREILKESILLLKRAERALAVDGQRSESDEKGVDSLRKYVEVERRRFEEQAVTLEASRRELRALQAPQPVRPAQPTTRPAAAGENRDDLQRRAEDAQLSLNLLQAQLNLLENSLNEQVSMLAGLEVRAADPRTKGSEPLAKELEAARKRYDDVRGRYLELKAKHAREQRGLFDLQQRAGMVQGGYR